ncbi:unnamed protein product [Scytosiphon promiscuus]
MSSPEEALPLRVSVHSDGPDDDESERVGVKVALGVTGAYLVVFTAACLPPLVALWHPDEQPVDQGGWSWLGANSLWLALALLWTLLHIDNGPSAATACLLCSVLWVYLNVLFLSQAFRGVLPLGRVDGLVHEVFHLVMLWVCLRAAWAGVAKKTPKTGSDGDATWRRVFRKWALVSASLLLLAVFVACWARNLPLTPPDSGAESAPWEWNSAIVFTMMLAVLWAAFLTRGGLVDETKRAACAWCALAFTGDFILCSFAWGALGLGDRNLVASVILAVEIVVLLVAAAI